MNHCRDNMMQVLNHQRLEQIRDTDRERERVILLTRQKLQITGLTGKKK